MIGVLYLFQYIKGSLYVLFLLLNEPVHFLKSFLIFFFLIYLLHNGLFNLLVYLYAFLR